ncbi:MAG TPA: M64 family metallopeptidase [Allosphingosinicella sp.]|nr:M64 family metallopeptidase [Allosphingosinicella sp.]
MAGAHLSIPINPAKLLASDGDFGLAAHSAAGPLSLQFVDADERPLGKPRPLEMPRPVAMEVPGGAGGFDWHKTLPPASVAVARIPAAAAAVHAFAGDNLMAAMPLAAAMAPGPTPPASRKIFNPAGRWKLTLVSDLFVAEKDFFDAAAALDSFIRGEPPFNEPTGARLQIEALFWPSPPGGLFNTKVDGRLVFGDNELVKRYLKKAKAKGELTIVLVNLGTRGGAGGNKERPAWVTITSAPSEVWQAVALHELGHSFGLADEYDDSSQTVPEPSKLEPNVTDKRDATKAPWAPLVTPGIAVNPTCPAGVVPPAPAGVVGTFEGARYKKTGRYRPTAECLMQRTDKSFCPVCQAQIRKALAAA